MKKQRIFHILLIVLAITAVTGLLINRAGRGTQPALLASIGSEKIAVNHNGLFKDEKGQYIELPYPSYDPLDYVDVGDYRNLTIAIQPLYQATEEQIKSETLSYIRQKTRNYEETEPNDQTVTAISDGKFSTMDELQSYMNEVLTETSHNSYITSARNKILNSLQTVCTVKKIPPTLIDFTISKDAYRMQHQAEQSGLTFSQLAENSGVTADELIQIMCDNVKTDGRLNEELILHAIAKAEGITMSHEEYQERLEHQAERRGYGHQYMHYLYVYGTETVYEEIYQDYIIEMLAARYSGLIPWS